MRQRLEEFTCSGKLVALKILLEKALVLGEFASPMGGEETEKVVIFSQKPAVLQLIVEQLLTRYEDLRYVVMSSSALRRA